jgi:5-methylcytosine-specific restriction protein B
MTDLKKQYDLWDEFLTVWPESRLAKMTLDEYTKAGSKDTFTYWIEARLGKMGSIWGGSAFKFLIFSRKETEAKISDGTLSYSTTHAWYSSLGDSADKAFTQIRKGIVQLARFAAEGDLDSIQAMEIFGEVYRWKIAFHYQNRHAPLIVNIFTKTPLKALLYNETYLAASMARLQRALVDAKPPDIGILEYGDVMWAKWSQQNLLVWKLSHGPGSFTMEEQQQFLQNGVAAIYGGTGVGQGKHFAEAPEGTLFYLCHGNSPQLVGQFTSPAIPCAKGDGWLQRSYRVLKLALRNDPYKNNSKKWSPQGNSTFWQVVKQDLALFDQTLLHPYFGTSLSELASMAGEPLDGIAANAKPIESDEMDGEQLLSRFDGKPSFASFRRTWSPEYQALFVRLARIVHNADLDWWHIGKGVQVRFGRKNPGFKQAIGVLGVVRGRGKQKLTWTRQVGRMAQCHRQPLTEELVSVIEAALNEPNEALSDWLILEQRRPGLWPDQLEAEAGELGYISEDEEDEEDGDDDEGVLSMREGIRQGFNRIYYGPPGTGKTYQLAQLLKQDYQPAALDDGSLIKRYCFVTFHQSYGYEEFVEGLRPVLDGLDAGQIRYEIRSGAFKELCTEARRFPDQRFAMVIDEINRGNISKIFGELITLIELDKREGASHAITLTLPYSGDQFSIPANVDIIGTMNTADRSLALVDTALRRRFDFVARMPNSANEVGAPLYELCVTFGEQSIDVPALLTRINQRIESLYDRDHTIGHAYFTGLRDAPDGLVRFKLLEQIFRNKIVPLLEEYFFEDWQKIRLILGDNQKSPASEQSACFITAEEDPENELVHLFGSDHGLNTFTTRKKFALNELAFSNPDAYVQIYASAS